jgi:hypothetical protein
MKRTICFLLTFLLIIPAVYSQKFNTLSKQEKKNGWILLFNGKDASNWKCIGNKDFSLSGWLIENEQLGLRPIKGNQKYFDIITKEEYSDFELTTDFKLTKGANSGIKYLFTNYDQGGMLGFEFQLLDDNEHPDAKLGHDGNRKTGSFYDMLPAAQDKKLNPVGEWNTARIICKGKHIEHWLNGKKVLEFENGSPAFIKALNQSKFKSAVPVFGNVTKGHIMLQYHQSEVWFRNIKIKNL